MSIAILSTGTVAAIEGETKREILGSSTGLPAQFFELSFKPLSYTPDGTCSLDVYVTENSIEERWTLVPSLLDSKPSEKHFEIEIDENDIVTVNFGDNQNGKVVQDFFMFPNVDFGQCVFMSDLIAAVDFIEGVRYVNLTILTRDVNGVGNVIISANEIPQFGVLSIFVFGGII